MKFSVRSKTAVVEEQCQPNVQRERGITMKKLLLLTLAVALVALGSIAWAGSNLNLSRSNINRLLPEATFLVTASTTLSNPREPQTVYTTPSTGDFVLTQVCTSLGNGGIELAADNLGRIAHVGRSGGSCQTFITGAVIPKASAITCSLNAFADAGSYFCMITGYLVPDVVNP